MKAIFIIHENDEPEQFEQMEKIKKKIHTLKGSWACKKIFSEQTNKHFYEYRFWAKNATLGDLV